jgi:hypothetical protein
MNNLPVTWLLVYFTVLVFDAFICVGCAYLVFWKGESGWWWALAILIMASEWAGAKKLLGIKEE